MQRKARIRQLQSAEELQFRQASGLQLEDYFSVTEAEAIFPPLEIQKLPLNNKGCFASRQV